MQVVPQRDNRRKLLIGWQAVSWSGNAYREAVALTPTPEGILPSMEAGNRASCGAEAVLGWQSCEGDDAMPWFGKKKEPVPERVTDIIFVLSDKSLRGGAYSLFPPDKYPNPLGFEDVAPVLPQVVNSMFSNFPEGAKRQQWLTGPDRHILMVDTDVAADDNKAFDAALTFLHHRQGWTIEKLRQAEFHIQHSTRPGDSDLGSYAIVVGHLEEIPFRMRPASFKS